MKGKRVEVNEKGPPELKEGEYGKDSRGVWFCRPPGSLVCCLTHHKVIEHKDKTITVTPSIMIDNGRNRWHGWLERGVWREA